MPVRVSADRSLTLRVDVSATTADKASGMGTTAWVHRCPWCEWSREASSATILAPRCDHCGGLLEAVAQPSTPSASAQLRAVAPQLSPVYGRLLRFMLVGLLLFAAARFGWHAGGLGLALAGVGIVGLFTVPLIAG
jgi:hypothetical protein